MTDWQDWPTREGWHETHGDAPSPILIPAIGRTAAALAGGFTWGYDAEDDPEYVPRDDPDWRGVRFRWVGEQGA